MVNYALAFREVAANVCTQLVLPLFQINIENDKSLAVMNETSERTNERTNSVEIAWSMFV